MVLALTPALSWGPVPPKDCGFIKVKSHRYNIKADQLRCDPAKRYSRSYLGENHKPKGYSCTKYSPSETAVRFRCTKGQKTFFAIAR